MDSLAPLASLVVEVDGGYHAKHRRADERRDRWRARAVYHVLRLDMELVLAVARIVGALRVPEGETEREYRGRPVTSTFFDGPRRE